MAPWIITVGSLAGSIIAGEPDVVPAKSAAPIHDLHDQRVFEPKPADGAVAGHAESFQGSLQSVWLDAAGAPTPALVRDALPARAGARSSGGVPEWQVHWRGHEVQTLAEPQWVEHVVRPRERLSELAARYGTRVDHIRLVNRLDRRRPLRPGQVLKIRATREVPPRERHVHVVGPAETWSQIAGRWKVPLADLRGWNSKVELEAGVALEVWYDPAIPWTVGRSAPGVPLDVEIPAGAESVGSPNRGRITHAVQMPASPLWTLRLPDYAWGSTHALTVVADAIAQMRASTGWNGTWVISSISKQGGGRFRPHKSHQSGRDFDIRLPVLPGRGVAEGGLADAEDIDWDATWALVSSLADSGHVTYVFLERRLQPRLADAARAAGVPEERIAQLVQSERGREDPLPLVKHERGHDHHIHVRVACGPDERRCRD